MTGDRNVSEVVTSRSGQLLGLQANPAETKTTAVVVVMMMMMMMMMMIRQCK